MPNEKRTLEIEARLRDFVSKNAKTMLLAVKSFASGALKAFGGLISAIVNLRNIFLGFFVVIAARRAFQGLKDIADELDNIVKTSEKVNATTRSLQELRFVAELNGASFESLTNGLGIFSKNLDLARSGSKLMAQNFERLGITMENLPLGPSGKVDLIELLARTADRMKTLENRTVGLSAAQNAFGRQGKELGVILSLTGDEIRAMADEAVRLGIVIDDAGLRRAADFKDALARLNFSLQAIKYTLFIELAPRLSAVFTKLTQVIADNKDKIVAIFTALGRELLAIFDAVARGVIGLIKAFERFFGSFLDPKKLRNQLASIEQEMAKLETAGEGAAAAFENLRRERDRVESELQAGGLGVFLEGEYDKLKAELADLSKLFGTVWDTEPIENTRRSLQGLQDDVGTQDFWAGFKKGAQDSWEAMKNLSAAGEALGRQLVEGTLNNLSNSISDVILGIKSAKEAFRDFAKQVISDLVRIIVKMAVVQSFSFASGGGFFGLAKGGVISGNVIPFEKYAKGGIASRPTMALFGEAGAEAFVPLQGGKIPVAFRGPSTGGIVLNLHVSAVDAKSVDELFVNRRGTLVAIVQDALRNRTSFRDAVGAA